MKRSTDLRTMTRLNHKAVKMSPEAGSTYSSRTLENFLPTSSHGQRPEPLREPREDVKVPEVLTSPPQHQSEPQTTSSFTPKERPEPVVERPVATTDRLIPKQSYCRQQDSLQELPKPRAGDTRIKTSQLFSDRMKFSLGPDVVSESSCFHSCKTQVHRWSTNCRAQEWTPHHQESAPSVPEDPEPQPDLVPPDCSPAEDKRFLLSSAKYNNIVHCDYAPLDPKVLKVYKDMKTSRCGKISRPPGAPRVIRYTGGGVWSTA
ncbi:hypothetical protein INR49_016260 [Caranx melampygus]|nr:hypothetical protein INR49_016260 [Caranx melampygus]